MLFFFFEVPLAVVHLSCCGYGAFVETRTKIPCLRQHDVCRDEGLSDVCRLFRAWKKGQETDQDSKQKEAKGGKDEGTE